MIHTLICKNQNMNSASQSMVLKFVCMCCCLCRSVVTDSLLIVGAFVFHWFENALFRHLILLFDISGRYRPCYLYSQINGYQIVMDLKLEFRNADGCREVVHVAPEYEVYTEQIKSLTSSEWNVLKTFCNSRNTVALIDVEGRRWVVKRFKRPTLANCVIYTWFRPNKAKRAFEYAFKLHDAGIETPAPVAYIEIFKNGFFHTGYFISEYLPYSRLDEVEEPDSADNAGLYRDFAAFTADMHRKNITHSDYNLSNVLWYTDGDGRHHFALVDINRMHFGRRSVKSHVKSLKGLSIPPGFLEEYCRLCCIDYSKTETMVSLYKYGMNRIVSMRRRLNRVVRDMLCLRDKVRQNV